MSTTETSAFFDEDFTKRARAHQMRKLWAGLASGALEFGVLVAFLFWYLGAENSPGGGFWSGFRVFCVAALARTLVSLPLDLYAGHVLAHRENLSNQSLGGWLWDRCKGAALVLLLGGAASGGLVEIMAAWPRGWWWPAALAGGLLMALLALVAPVLLAPLFFRFKPLEDETLEARLLALLARTKARVYGGVWEMGMRAKTKTANAALVGWGPSRRVVLSDTLLDFTPDEIEAVLAHEIAHHAGRHIPILLAARGAALALGLYIAGHVLTWLGGWTNAAHLQPGEAACVLLVWVVLCVVGAAASPAFLAVSRALERRCDLYAAAHAQEPEGLATALVRLCRQNLTDPEPPRWVVALFHSHPPVAERLERLASRNT